MLAEEVRRYTNRCDVPSNDIPLVNAEDLEVYIATLELQHEREVKDLQAKIRYLESDMALVEKRNKRW